MNTRRDFLSTAAKVAAAAAVLPLSMLTSPAPAPPALPVEKVVVHEMDGGSWAWCVWNGQDIDGILEYGNSGPGPLWGDDFKLEHGEHGWEVSFLSFSPYNRAKRSRALAGDCIYRLPHGIFFVMHSCENARKLYGDHYVLDAESFCQMTERMTRALI